MNAKVQELLEVAVEAVRSLGVDYAIGGAVAMEAHGFARETQDVDLFALDDDRVEVLQTLRKYGLVVFPIMTPYHYGAKFPHETNPEVRIDVMFPAGEPELSAVEWPEECEIQGVKCNVFSVTLLVMAKFYTNRDDKDIPDLAGMMHRGLFNPREVYDVMQTVDPSGAQEFAQLIARLRIASQPRPRPTTPIRPRKPRGKK